MGPVEIAYMAGALVLALVLLRRAANKPFMAVVLFWLLGYPILGQPQFIPKLGALGVGLQPARVLLLLLGAALILRFIHAASTGKSRRRTGGLTRGRRYFEWFMLCYVGLACLALLTNLSDLDGATVRELIAGWITFPVMYWAARLFGTARDYAVLCVACVALAATSSLVGIMQFVSPGFFHTAFVPLVAFGSHARSPGLFEEEYYQGMLLIMVLLISLFAGLRGVKYLGLFLLCSGGIFLTFHRLTWVVFSIMTTLLILPWMRRHTSSSIGMGAGAVFVMSLLLLFQPWQVVLSQDTLNQFIQQRLFVNTITFRGDLNAFALHLIQTYPWGIGDYSNPIYHREAFIAGIVPRYNVQPLVIHNGILASAVNSGIPGMLAMLAFLSSALVYFGWRSVHGGSASILPLLLTTVVILYQSTNDFSSFGTYPLLFYALMLGFTEAQDAESRIELAVVPQRKQEVQKPWPASSA